MIFHDFDAGEQSEHEDPITIPTATSEDFIEADWTGFLFYYILFILFILF